MGRIMLTLFILSLAGASFAQTQGKVSFEEKIDLHRSIPEDRAEMKEMIPPSRSLFFELYYTEASSIYKMVEAPEEEEVVRSDGGMRMHMRMTPPRREVYKNLEEDLMVDEREFMTKLFLIKGNTTPYAWKIGDGQKMILDYPCLQALYSDTTDKYVVWFTPQIQISNGPAEFGGLPGMILQVDINDGERVITATELTEMEVDPDILQKPTKGKEVTQEEYDEIVREKRREMREMHGGGGPGGPVIMIRRD